jgi:ribosomal protein S12 methylthiotransferase
VDESIEAILTLAEHKRNGACRRLIVTGCMAERYRDEITKEIPETDAVLGVREFHRIAEVISNGPEDGTALGRTGRNAVKNTDIPGQPEWNPSDAEAFFEKRLLLPVPHTVPVKIADGCDNRCAYCTIPAIRGPYRSRPFESIVNECAKLAGRGARELVLVAQDTALYGTDLYGRPRLHELIGEIASIRDLTWLRLMYAYPEHVTADIIRSFAENEKICRYLDMPVQHSNEAVLKRMGRKGTAEGLRALIAEWRERVPGIILRTTLMTGFPGETEEEFGHLVRFAEEMRFDRLGVFAYSREDGTTAAGMKPQINSGVKKARRDRLMKLQREIHREKQAALVGQVLTVMVDAVTEEDGAYRYEGRSYRDAPETDTAVLFSAGKVLFEPDGLPTGSGASYTPRGRPVKYPSEGERRFGPGDMAEVRITGHDDYDLFGEAM